MGLLEPRGREGGDFEVRGEDWANLEKFSKME